MSRILILSKQVAELIAAGEVVERPASVVKEIMENSIDAGSSSITIEIKNGGITYIRITDSGSGIEKDDIENAFKSHATSKISSAEDLDSITTLGFRGEALASIAAVSKVEMLTRAANDEYGSRYCMEGGDQVLFDQAGCPKGTTLIIRDLFYNTPARMKFLKKDVAEANAVAGVVDRIALSHPEVSVRFIRDGKQTLLTPGDGKLISAVYSIFGKDFAAGLIDNEYMFENIKVSGFVSKPAAARPNRSMQFFFLNGRLIKTVTGTTALNEAYKNSIMIGKFPSCVLNIEISPDLVDINVHPSKIEARFVNEKQLFNAVFYCAKNALNCSDTRPSIQLQKHAAAQYINNIKQVQQMNFPAENAIVRSEDSRGGERKNKANIDIEVDEEDTGDSEEKNISSSKVQTSATSAAENTDSYLLETESGNLNEDNPESESGIENTENGNEKKAHFIAKIIGEIFNTYIIVETGNKIIIVDKHAAHERIIYNSLVAGKQDASHQILLTPVTVLLSKDEYSAVLENTEILIKAGFDLEDFGPGMILVRECPMTLVIGDISDIVIELAEYLVYNKNNMFTEKLDWLLQSIACRAAIKAGDFTSDFERKQFVDQLMQMPDVRYCPHGRPVYIEMKRSELEKSFGRT